MQGDETLLGERRETIEELSALLFVVQEMGQRLAYETHGEPYDLVRELNEILHQARQKMQQVQNATKSK